VFYPSHCSLRYLAWTAQKRKRLVAEKSASARRPLLSCMRTCGITAPPWRVYCRSPCVFFVIAGCDSPCRAGRLEDILYSSTVGMPATSSACVPSSVSRATGFVLARSANPTTSRLASPSTSLLGKAPLTQGRSTCPALDLGCKPRFSSHELVPALPNTSPHHRA
jgi:hypothetical protein